ncbi:MAG TPA: hypothetical protein VE685_25150, partial [Thermoanaerobaculia bacterium]|nr:hypothetical protein [Thermoanaerobaculia bacterium]
MEGIWLVSYIVLWIAVAVLAVLCLSLLRLVGQLHERIGPAGAMVIDQGPEIGSRLPALLEVGRLRGKFPLEFPGDRDRLLIFVSPNCEACVRLMKSLIPFSRRYRGELDVLLVSHSSDPDGNERFAADARRGDLPYL